MKILSFYSLSRTHCKSFKFFFNCRGCKCLTNTTSLLDTLQDHENHSVVMEFLQYKKQLLVIIRKSVFYRLTCQ